MQIRHFTAAQVIDPEIEAYYRIHSTLNNINTLHTHEYFELHFVTKGVLKHTFADGTSHDHGIGTLLFIRPEDVHVCLSADGEDCHYINLAFSKETVHELMRFLGHDFFAKRLLSFHYPPAVRLPGHERNHFLQRFEKIAILPTHQKERIKTQLRSLLTEALIRYYTASDSVAHESDTPQWLSRVYDDMLKKENFILGTQRMVELSGKSHHHLCREFKKHYQVTPTDFLNSLRLNYAANMLTYSFKSVTDIAMDLNFNNLSHFHHLFKTHYGLTPSKFRKKIPD